MKNIPMLKKRCHSRSVLAGILFFLIIPIFIFSITGCGVDYRFKKAQGLGKDGNYIEAGLEYEKIFLKNPNNARAPEAMYRMGLIYQKKLKIYSHAYRYYKELLDKYPSSEPWAELARRGLFDSPDYFPLSNGSFWIEGDSATGGRNMRAEWNCTGIPSGIYSISRRFFAGEKLVTASTRYFRKKNLELNEATTPRFNDSARILVYPFAQGKSWKTIKDGNAVIYTVISENVALKVQAGDFAGCIKISEENPDLPGTKKYNYYAPSVGWVLTTISGSAGNEHKNTELLSYKINPEE